MDRNSPWGIVLQSASEWDIRELHKGGVAWLRIDIPWDLLQPTANEAFPESRWLYFDRLVRWATDRGLWILFGLGGTPRWAVDPARLSADGNRYLPRAYPAQDLAKWAEYVRRVVTRYGAKVQHWGIWNEPNSRDEPDPNVVFWRGSKQEFLDGVLTRAVNVIRGFGPDHRICVPDLAGHGGIPRPWSPSWLAAVLAKVGRDTFAASVHIYKGTGDGSDIADGAGIAQSVVQSYNSNHGTRIELWVTETGWHTSQHSEAVISQKIQDLCNSVRQTSWFKKVFPYVWSDNFNDSFTFKSGLRTTRLQWEGYKTGIRSPQTALPLERDSLVVNSNVPLQMVRGQSYDVRMTLSNVGRWTWPKQGSIRLAFGSRPSAPSQPYSLRLDISDARLFSVMQLSSALTAPFRVQALDRAPVATGGETTFSFRVTAPAQPGFYLAAWCMVDDNPADAMFFGQGVLQMIGVS